jgi:citrate synthase
VQPDPADPRRSLYNAEDLEALATRRRRGRSAQAIAASAFAWGEAAIPTRISTIAHGRLIYRGHDAVTLAETATLEEAAALLWDVPAPAAFVGDDAAHASAFVALAALAETAPATIGRAAEAQCRDGVAAVARLADGFGLPGTGKPMHARLAWHWGQDATRADLLRRALVLLADHELNASTFAVRVAASTGAPIAACLLAGLATLTGPRHGGAGAALAMLIERAERHGTRDALDQWLGLGLPVPGFGHQLYPEGDVRAQALLAHLPPDPLLGTLAEAVAAATGALPNVDYALASLQRHLALPADAPFVIFALGRSIGWVAHAIEQVASGTLIRPRARYEGP